MPGARHPFAIGGAPWPGLSKLIEELGEAGQVCGKLIATGGQAEHWDGTNLRDRLQGRKEGQQEAAVSAWNGVYVPTENAICRTHCTMCEGLDHHWMYVGDEDDAGEPVISCKHCDAMRPIEDDDEG